MVYRRRNLAPRSQVTEERRGSVAGRFCHACGSVYPRFANRHAGKPVYGKDHVSSPCSHEGEAFDPEDTWWEPAVELLPAAEPSEADEADADASV